MKSLELLDSWISRKVRTWSSRLSGESRAPELLEIRRELLNDVRDQIHPIGRGNVIFPYRTVNVHIAARNSEQRQLLEGTFLDGNDLQQDFVSLLSEAGCTVPSDLHVIVDIVDDPVLAVSSRPFCIDYSTRPVGETAAAGITRPTATLTVLRGKADPMKLTIQSDRAYLGRLKEVVSDTGSLRRRNDIAFAESETTVSREHALITYDRQSATFRLHDARNQRGTSIFRDSRELRVPKGSSRGLELKSGDEIHLGEARLRFDIEPQ